MRKLLFILFSFVAIASYGKKINEEAIKTFCREAGNAVAMKSEEADKQSAFDAQATAWSKLYELQQITDKQVEMLFENGGLNLDKYLRKWLEPVLTSKAQKESAFAFLAWKYMPENDGFIHSDKEVAALMRFLGTNDLQKQFDQNPDYALEILNSLSTMKDANWHTEGFPEAIRKMMKCNLPELSVLECVKAFNSIARVDVIDNEHKEDIRQSCIKLYEQMEKSVDNARKQKTCQEQIKYLKGPFACGTLVGGKAPELHIIRAYKDNGNGVETIDIKSLDDLKGKVVMIDFWGTKCVPCLQSFSEIAELQKRFEGKDVVILGITSLQGYFVDTPNHRTIQCRNNPEKELGCFPDFMKAMGVNWAIAITEENVMNTDFGVLAIPHVTLIDKKGTVRHNAINLDNEEKSKLIESLLEE